MQQYSKLGYRGRCTYTVLAVQHAHACIRTASIGVTGNSRWFKQDRAPVGGGEEGGGGGDAGEDAGEDGGGGRHYPQHAALAHHAPRQEEVYRQQHLHTCMRTHKTLPRSYLPPVRCLSRTPSSYAVMATSRWALTMAFHTVIAQLQSLKPFERSCLSR